MAAKRIEKRLFERVFRKKWKDFTTNQVILVAGLIIAVATAAIMLLGWFWPRGTSDEQPQIDVEPLVAKVMAASRELGQVEESLSQSEREKEDLKKQLTQAFERVAELEAQADDAEAADAVRQVRESGDTAKLLAVLIREREKHQEERIKLDREIAAVAFLRGEIETARQAVGEILAADPNDLYALSKRGHIHWFQGRLAEAEHDCRRLLDLAKDDDVRAVGLGDLGLVYKTRGDFYEAEQVFRKALAIFKERGLWKGVAVQSRDLGLVYRERGNPAQAEQMCRQALAISEQLGWREGMASAYGDLGNLYQTCGDLAQAEQMHRQALAINAQLGRRAGMAADYGNLGNVYRVRGDVAQAEQMCRQALAISEQLGWREGMANAYGALGLVYDVRSDLAQAEQMHRRALAIFEEVGNLAGMAYAYGNLGVLYKTRGRLAQAEEMYRKALAISEQLGHGKGMATSYANLSGVHKARGDLAQARGYGEKALELFTKMGMQTRIQEIQEWLAGLKDKE